jgi:hypothetical protein
VDTDDDGLPDGADPYPLYAIDERIPYRAAEEAGTVALAQIDQRCLRARLFLDWNEAALTLRCVMDPPASLQVCLDGRDDGRWRGADNYEVFLDPGEASARLRIWDARPGFYAFDTDKEYAGKRRLVAEDDLQVAWARDEWGGCAVSVGIPGHDLCGPRLRSGATFGLRVEFQSVPEAPGGAVSLFERWHFPVFKLVRRRPGSSHVAAQGGFGLPFLDDGRGETRR